MTLDQYISRYRIQRCARCHTTAPTHMFTGFCATCQNTYDHAPQWVQRIMTKSLVAKDMTKGTAR